MNNKQIKKQSNALICLLAFVSVAMIVALLVVVGQRIAKADDNSQNTSITLSPATITTDIDPGTTKTSSVKVKNSGIDAYDFEMSISPYTVQGEEYDAQFTENNEQTQISKWVNFTNGTRFHANPGEEVEVKFTVSVPANSICGGQYAVIFAKTVPSADSNKSTGVTIAKRVGSLLFAKVSGDIIENGTVYNQSIPFWVWNSKIDTSFLASNEGNVDNSVKFQLQVNGLFGKIYSSDPNYSRLVFPNKTRHLTQSSDKITIPGIYTVEQNITYLNSDFSIKKYVIVCPAWALAGLITLIVLLIFVIWYAKTNRKRKVKKMAKKMQIQKELQAEAERLVNINADNNGSNPKME